MPVTELKNVNISFSQELENIHYWETDTTALSPDDLLEAASTSGILDDTKPLDILIFNDDDGAVLFDGFIITRDGQPVLLSQFNDIPSLDEHCFNFCFKASRNDIALGYIDIEGITATPPSTKNNARRSLISQILSGELFDFAKGLHATVSQHDDPEAIAMTKNLDVLLKKYEALIAGKTREKPSFQRVVSFNVELYYSLDDDGDLMNIPAKSLQERLTHAINNERINGCLTNGLDISADLADVSIMADFVSSSNPDD